MTAYATHTGTGRRRRVAANNFHTDTRTTACASEVRQRDAIDGWIRLFKERGIGDRDETVFELRSRRSLLETRILAGAEGG